MSAQPDHPPDLSAPDLSAPEAEQLNPEAFAGFAARADEGPVVMLNLLAFRPDGGAERYAEYGAAVQPLLEGVGGTLIHTGVPSPTLIGDGEWDLVLLVSYPTRGAFIEMVSSREYQAIAHLRSEALEASELHPLDPLGGVAID